MGGESSYNRAHGKGEPKVLRSPCGCEVIFMPQDTKGLSHGNSEGTGEVGVLAGYGLNAGYHWDGECFCWSRTELARICMHEYVLNHLLVSELPIGLREGSPAMVESSGFL